MAEIRIGRDRRDDKVSIVTLPAELMQQILDHVGRHAGMACIDLADIEMLNFVDTDSGQEVSFIRDDPKTMTELIDARRKVYGQNGKLPRHMMWVVDICKK